MNWYVRLLAAHPYVVAALVAAVTGACITLALVTKPLPDFSDPMLGFETRGTTLSLRLSAWNNLQRALQGSGPLTANPSQEPASPHFWMQDAEPPVPDGRPQVIVSESEVDSESEEGDRSDWSAEAREWQDLTQLERTGTVPDLPPPPHASAGAHRWFCGPLVKEYGRVVFGPAVAGSSLFHLDQIRSMCRVEQRQLRTYAFPEFCQLDEYRQTCCRSWSLGNYIALLHNRTHCSNIQDEDVAATLQLLRECSHHYHSQRLQPDCHQRPCRGVPARCARHDAVFHLMHFVLDTGFMPPDEPHQDQLSFAMTYLPVARSGAVLPYYRSLRPPLTDNSTAVVAMDLGLKAALFDATVAADAVYVGAACAVVVLLMWAFTGSLLITMATLTAVALSLATAYFVYVVVLELKFFPFMNLLAVIIAIGVGADDTFIFCKVWERCKSEPNAGTLAKLVDASLRQAALSMLVTSLTTAAAFLASCVSYVTAIACFSIFSGTTILINFLLMISWTPAFVVLRARFCQWCAPRLLPRRGGTQRQPRRCCAAVTDCGRVLFDKLLPCAVVRLRWLWLVTLGGLAVAAAVVVCYHPRLRLPETQQFQLFRASHLFEKYDRLFMHKFWFERSDRSEVSQSLPLRFVWGVVPVDGGDRLNPADRGELKLDPRFNIATKEAQLWLLQFCRDLRQQAFYQSTQGPLLPNCFIETFKAWMDERPCENSADGGSREPCCETAVFPYSEAVFNECLVRAVRSLHNTPSLYFIAGLAGPKFEKSTGRVAAVVVEYDSNYTFSLSHEKMERFVSEVESWMAAQLTTAPPGMAGGWFISFTDFYDLQTALANGTLLSIGVAVGLAFLVLMFTTLDILVSLFAAVTIACIIFVTVASLILLGWRLNILEAVAVTVAIGLSVDFALHYSVAYRTGGGGGQPEDRETRVVHALSSVGSPIAMAALTSIAAGACMLPSSLLAYVQIGIFLVLLTGVSWVYATFLFLSLLRLWGPERPCGPCIAGTYGSTLCRERSTSRTDKSPYNYTVSESTLSTSSNAFLHPGGGAAGGGAETYELQPLTPGQRRRPWRVSQPDVRQRSASVGDAVTAPADSPRSRKKSLPSLTTSVPRQWADAGSATTVVICEDRGDIEPNKCAGVPDVWVRRA